MADRPILFSAPMVRALLDGSKTQTRRVLKDPEFYGCPTGDCPHQTQAECNAAMAGLGPEATRYAIGDRLYVREHWSSHPSFDGIAPRDLKRGSMVYTRADHIWHNNGDWIGAPYGKHRQAMHMPRWASRLTLTVTDVRVERLQDCSEADAITEGIYRLGGLYCHSRPGDRFGNENAIAVPAGWDQATHAYQALWDRINGPGAWEANPWVVAVSFTVGHHNIDAEARS